MSYLEIDRFFIRLYLHVARLACKIGITGTMLINTFLLIQISAQIVQIAFLYQIGKGITTICIITGPTIFLIWYFRKMVLSSKDRPVWIDFVRVFANLYTVIRVAMFSWYGILCFLGFNTFFREEFVSQVSQLLMAVSFMSILYLLTISGERPSDTTRPKLPK